MQTMEVYKQTTEYTCAACSLLMAIHEAKPGVPLTRESEFLFWQKTANLPVRASSIYGLAIVAKEHGLRPRVVVEEREYDYPDYRFKGYTKKEIDEAKFCSKLYAKRAREAGIPIEERSFSFEDVNKELAAGKRLLLRVNAGVFRDTKSTSKYVVVYREGKQLFVVDPRRGLLRVDQETLIDAMETLLTKKKRDARMLVFD